MKNVKEQVRNQMAVNGGQSIELYLGHRFIRRCDIVIRFPVRSRVTDNVWLGVWNDLWDRYNE